MGSNALALAALIQQLVLILPQLTDAITSVFGSSVPS